VKPPYRVPSMREIRSVEWNGLTIASTFTGAGGSDLGFMMAGFRVRYTNDWDAHARSTYEANHPGLRVDDRDIRDVPAADIIGACGGRPNGLAMSPPCPSYSSAGKRRGAADPRDRFSESITKVGEVRPTHFFTLENVPEIAQGPHRDAFNAQVRRAKAFGYRVEARVVDAQWLGVPQRRERLIMIGISEGLGLDPPFPTPLAYRYGVRDALAHVVRVHDYEYGRCRTQSADLPFPTITASGQPHEAELADGTVRPFEIGELKTLFSFPGDFALDGPKTDQHARIGNAVPPLMMFHIATAIRRTLEARR
jgi:DNA (cytosine-5)-methyltransferase 1